MAKVGSLWYFLFVVLWTVWSRARNVELSFGSPSMEEASNIARAFQKIVRNRRITTLSRICTYAYLHTPALWQSHAIMLSRFGLSHSFTRVLESLFSPGSDVASLENTQTNTQDVDIGAHYESCCPASISYVGKHCYYGWLRRLGSRGNQRNNSEWHT